jgi:hypothetical protein
MAWNQGETAAANMGAIGGSISPVHQATWDTTRGLAESKINRDQLTRNYTRGVDDRSREAAQAWRQLPQAYNQRGMIDSGQYQRGGNQLAQAIDRLQGRALQDYSSQIDYSHLQDTMSLQNLDELKDLLSAQDYQNVVANVVRGSGGMA